MDLLNVSVLKQGSKVGKKIGNPQKLENSSEGDTRSIKQSTSSTLNGPQQQVRTSGKARNKTSMKGNINITPISMLSLNNDKWTIKVRVTSKSEMQRWSKSPEARYFSMLLADQSGEIRCTAFKDEADRFFSIIEGGKLYYITNGWYNLESKVYSTLYNEFEIELTRYSEITPCHDDDRAIPTLSFNFTPISGIERLEPGRVTDILGIVDSYDDILPRTRDKTQMELIKRDVHLVDDSNTMITLTLWESLAEECNVSGNPVLAVKAVRIGKYMWQKNLRTTICSIVQCDPDIPEAHNVYFRSGGINGVFEIEDLVDVLRKEKAKDIFVARVPPEYTYVDYMVIVTGRSGKHMSALATHIRKLFKLKKHSKDIIPKIEGKSSSDWLALDLGNIALHIFSSNARMRYDLETLWTVGAEYDDESNKPAEEEDSILQKYNEFLAELEPAESAETS